MKSLSGRIDAYMQRKGFDRQTAVDTLLLFALDTLDARMKGGRKTGNRPEQARHLAKARRQRHAGKP
jgi:hypothetical protein